MEIDLSLLSSVNGAFKFWVKQRRITSISFPFYFPGGWGPQRRKRETDCPPELAGWLGASAPFS